MPKDLTSGIVRILRPDGQTAGTGFVVSTSGLLVTCAHVVQEGRSVGENDSKPDRIEFVFLASGISGEALVVDQYWKSGSAEDVAFLQFEGTLPESVQPLPLGCAAGTSGHPFRTFGFPSTNPENGIWGNGTIGQDISDQDGRRRVQISSNEVSTGFSGAPLLDISSNVVVGVIVSIASPDQHLRQLFTNFIIPIETVQTICPELCVCEYATGIVYDESGYPARDTIIKTVINGNTRSNTKSSEQGEFILVLPQQVDQIDIIATKHDKDPRQSVIKSVMRKDALRDGIKLNLESEQELNGIVKRFGAHDPIRGAEILVTILGDEKRTIKTNQDGNFKVFLPNHGKYELSVECDKVERFFRLESSIGSIEQPVRLLFAKSCKDTISETILIERICDDLEINFVHVQSGDFKMGPTDSISTKQLNEYYICRYPITRLQYSFYLQNCPNAALPLRWRNSLPLANQENYPVTGISWYEAVDFCSWLEELTGVKHRLPTDLEWEKAARGVDGRKFPWGNDGDINFIIEACNSSESQLLNPTAVDRYQKGRSPFGAWDMAGNVWEWTSSPPGDCPNESREAQGTPSLMDFRVCCGGSYMDPLESLTCYSRESFSAAKPSLQVGFRVLRERGN